MKKKLLAVALTATMLVGSSLTAFASSTTDITSATEGVYGATIEGDTEVKVPTISVTVPTDLGNIGLNPYQMTFTPTGGEESTDQIISATHEIVNGSDVAIAVNVAELKGTADSPSQAVFVTAAPTEKITTKAVFMYLVVDKKGADLAVAYDSKATNQILVGTKPVAKTNLIVLDADGGTAPTAEFTFRGSLATNPATAWSGDDKFKVSLKFTFIPQVVKATTTP